MSDSLFPLFIKMSLLLHAQDFKSGDQVYYEGHGLQAGKPYSQPWIYIKSPEELLQNGGSLAPAKLQNGLCNNRVEKPLRFV